MAVQIPLGFPWPISELGYKAMERALSRALIKTWNKRSDAALEDFMRELEKHVGQSVKFLRDEDIENFVLPYFADRLGNSMLTDPDLAIHLANAISDAPLFGKLDVCIDVLSLYPQTSYIDEKAKAWLQKDSAFWIGTNYDRNVREKIAEIGRTVGIEQGLGLRDAGRAMKAEFGKQFAKSHVQWEVVGSAVTSRGRWAGMLGQYSVERVVKMKRLTMNDEAVCPTCGAMDGMILDVSSSLDTLERIMGAESPEDAKQIAPWINYDNNHEWTDPNTGEKKIGSSYYQLPSTGKKKYFLEDKITDSAYHQKHGLGESGQIHALCRCTVIAEEFEE